MDPSLPIDGASNVAENRTFGLLDHTLRLSVRSLFKIALYCWDKVGEDVIEKSFGSAGIFPLNDGIWKRHWELINPRSSILEDTIERVSSYARLT